MTDGEPLTEDPDRRRRADRRKSHMDAPLDDDGERRRRRDERRAIHSSDAPKSSRRKSAPIVDGYFDPRNGSKSREPEYLPADGPVYKDSKPKKDKKDKAGWPHSGTDSWVKDHSDAPPPPEDSPVDAAPDDTTADETARRTLRKSRRQSKYDDDAANDQEERQRRREERRAARDKATVKSSEGSQGDGRRSSRRDSGFVETTSRSRGPSEAGGLFSRWKKIAGV